MRKLLVGFLVLVAVLAVAVGPALACINDRESQRSEKEFRSSYIEVEKPAYQPPPPPENNLLIYGGSGLGASLLLGAGLLGLVRSRRG